MTTYKTTRSGNANDPTIWYRVESQPTRWQRVRYRIANALRWLARRVDGTEIQRP